MENISWIDHVRNEERLQRVKQEINILQTIKEGRLTGLVIISVRNCILKYANESKTEGRKNEEEDVSRYWMTLRKGENTGVLSESIRSHPVENSLLKKP
jgi:hypothetical protein